MTDGGSAVRQWLWRTQGLRLLALVLPLLAMAATTVAFNVLPPKQSGALIGLGICLGFYLTFAIPYLGGALFYSLSVCSRKGARNLALVYLALPSALFALTTALESRGSRVELTGVLVLSLLMLVTGLVLLGAHFTRRQAGAADAAISHLRDQNLLRALEYVRLAGILGGDDADAIRSLALNFANGKQGDLALKLSEALIQSDPGDANNWRAHAHFSGRMGRSEQAWQAFEQAIRLEPKNGDIYFDRAVQLLGEGEAEKAMTDYTHAIRLDAKNAKFLANRAGLHAMLGHLELAKNDATAALALDPQDPVARNVIACCS